MFVLFNED